MKSCFCCAVHSSCNMHIRAWRYLLVVLITLPFKILNVACIYNNIFSFFVCMQGDFEIQHADRIKACSTPRLLATGSLEEISSLALIAERMVVVKLR